MKRILAVVVLVLMFLAIFFTVGTATKYKPFEEYTWDDPELDLTQYTLEDLKEMSVDELRHLVAEFERVYEPYGSYAKRHGLNK